VPVTAVVGAQWGDEGKGKITDYLAQRADLVIRYQGGNNAGHTVVNEHGTFKLHLVPSGIFNPDALCVLGPGTVVDLPALCEELAMLEAHGIATSNVRVSTVDIYLQPDAPAAGSNTAATVLVAPITIVNDNDAVQGTIRAANPRVTAGDQLQLRTDAGTLGAQPAFTNLTATVEIERD